ncbi:MAG: hypothetical protein KatS3mg105_4113 [Gemmatales bacterium]|nr:MAG: hypothetical protein KatS3mg105_4113 [Gemmatales bacterium]
MAAWAMSHLLSTPQFRQAVARIELRAEKQADWQRLGDVFVRTDLFDRVRTSNSQLVLGRRGTGKTHLLRVFENDAAEHGELVFYVDCTRLASGYSGLGLAPEIIAKKYFVSFLNQIGTELLDKVVRLELPPAGKEHSLISRLVDGLVPLLENANGGESRFNYRQIGTILEDVIAGIGGHRLYIVLDEWAQVPFSSQPHFAEYLKRSILAVPQISVKILAVNYQCQFSVRQNSDIIGLERGADIPDVIDMDRYLIYDEKRDFVVDFFAQLLYNHLGVELGWKLSASREEKRRTVESLFTQQRTFIELVRAAEGNCRDFLCIFGRAYWDEFRHSSDSRSISIPNIVRAAASWYDTEKAATINTEPEAKKTLEFLLNSILKNYKSRTFLVESSKAEHPLLGRLLNERVLHRLNGTYSHADRPGILHDLFTIDYGAYVRFRGTVNQVHEEVFWEGEATKELDVIQKDLLVPVDDKRSIRRITFDPDGLEVAGDTPDKAN